jgi:hypothetical protein
MNGSAIGGDHVPRMRDLPIGVLRELRRIHARAVSALAEQDAACEGWELLPARGEWTPERGLGLSAWGRRPDGRRVSVELPLRFRRIRW